MNRIAKEVVPNKPINEALREADEETGILHNYSVHANESSHQQGEVASKKPKIFLAGYAKKDKIMQQPQVLV